MKLSIVCIFLFFCTLGMGQQLSRKTLKTIKDNTVFIRTNTIYGQKMGTGFVFKKSKDSVYIFTCAHVISGTKEVDVITNSGTSYSKIYKASVIAEDPDKDLACLMIPNNKFLPSGLIINLSEEIKETQVLYVAGFPFGDFLSQGDKNPEISINKVSVSSIRKNREGQILRVQLSGDINSGNSGGPAINEKGQIIGIIQSKIRFSSTAFAIPTSHIEEFGAGNILPPKFETVFAKIHEQKMEVTIPLIDPLAKIREVGIAYIIKSKVKNLRNTEKGPVHEDMQIVKMKPDNQIAKGRFIVSRTEVDPQITNLLIQTYYVGDNGEKHWGKAKYIDIVFGDFNQPEKNDTPVVQKLTIKLPDELKISNKLILNSVIADIFLTKEEKHLFALNLSEGKIHKILTENLRIDQSISVADNAVAMAISPDEKTLCVVGHTPVDKSINNNVREGFVHIFSAIDLMIQTKIPVKFAPLDVIINNKKLIYLSIISQLKGLVVVNASNKKTTGIAYSIPGEGIIKAHPDGTRIYVKSTNSSNIISCVILWKKKAVQGALPNIENYSVRAKTKFRPSMQGDFTISPDGQYLMSCSGIILRLAKSQQADFQYITQIDPYKLIATHPQSDIFFTADDKGIIKAYSLKDFKLQKSYNTTYYCSQLIFAAKTNKLYAVAGHFFQKTFSYRRSRDYQVGNLITIPLK